MNYESYYKNIRNKYGTYSQSINTLNSILTLLFYIAYPILLIILFLYKDTNLLKMILIPGISFVCVSVFRKLYNEPRPYEVYKIDPIIKKDTKGKSMPSRHIFSSSMISMCYLYFNVYAGILLLLISVVSSYIRVIGGVHFKKDVIIGYFIGVIFGILFYII